MSTKSETAGAEISPVMQTLSAYIAGAAARPLPDDVAEKGKHHLLDTIAAIVSGARLLPGEMAIKYARLQGGVQEALVLGSDVVTSATIAALANGMSAHADETDDSHKASRSHLGCAVVPAAMAMAEKEGTSGEALLRAVVLGYDVGARSTLSLGADELYDAAHSTHSFAALFGAAAAASALAGLSQEQVRWSLSYAAQQCSGVNCWRRDKEHVEKAFDFGGMGARNGVAAATMVQAGFTGVDDVFSGQRNFYLAFGQETTRPELLSEGLGERYEIMLTNIKKWSVGSPIQAMLDSTQALVVDNDLRADDIVSIRARLSDRESNTVDNRTMPDICLQHMVSVMVADRDLTFLTSHDYARMQDPAILAIRAKVELVADSSVPRRQGVIEIKTKDGRDLVHSTQAVRGTPENRMTREDVERKAVDLMQPVLGREATAKLVDAVWNIERVQNARALQDYCRA